ISLMAGDATTDAGGRFRIQYAPPGDLKLTHMARTDESNAYAHVPIRDLHIIPGETTNADYEEKGIAATVHLRWPAGFNRIPQHRVFCGASVPYPRPTPEEMADPAALAQWRERPEVKAAMTKMRGSQFIEKAGLWTAENIEPGEWSINATIFEQKPNPSPGQRLLPLLVGTLKV